MQPSIFQTIWKFKTNLLGTVIVLLVIIAMLVSSITSQVVSSPQPYVNEKALAKYETAFVGDSSKVGHILRFLPMLDNYGDDWFSLDTNTSPYGLQVYYDHFNFEKPWDPYSQFTKDSNALLLFRYIHNLEQIRFLFYSGDPSIPREQREYEAHDCYQRADFEAKYGDLNQLTAKDLENIISAGRAIDDAAHYNRVRWGAPLEWVIYRNGEPDCTTENIDGSLQLDYFDLGSAGQTVRFYLDSPDYVAMNLDGVYQVHVSGWESEISWHCDITSASQQEMLDRLGAPQSCMKIQDGSSRYLYPVYGEKEQKYIYFDCQDGQIIAHGLGYGLGLGIMAQKHYN